MQSNSLKTCIVYSNIPKLRRICRIVLIDKWGGRRPQKDLKSTCDTATDLHQSIKEQVNLVEKHQSSLLFGEVNRNQTNQQ